ncbi:MAG: hypothetical protein ROO71_13260 [Balneola sp.]
MKKDSSQYMRLLGLIIFGFIFQGGILIAQPFSSIEIGSSISNSTIQDKSYSERWYAENKLSFSISTPFYVGHLRAYFDLIVYEERPNVPVGFNTKNYALGLVHRFSLNHFLYVDLGGSFGIQEIAQDVPNVTSDSIERELFFGGVLEPGFQTRYALFYGSLEYRKIFFYERQHIYFLGGGMRFKLDVPERIKRFID